MGAHMRGVIRGVTQVLRKRWAYLRGSIRGGGGAYRLRNTLSEALIHEATIDLSKFKVFITTGC